MAGKASELKSFSYWVGHLITLLATVIGVYYAAIAGFDVAVKLESVNSNRSTYYLSSSLHDELKFNVDHLQGYIDKLQGKTHASPELVSGLSLNDFIFHSAANSASIFEIDPKLLAEISTFYFSVGNAVTHYSKTNARSPNMLMLVVKTEVEKLKAQQTLERLSQFKLALEQKLIADKVELLPVTLN